MLSPTTASAVGAVVVVLVAASVPLAGLARQLTFTAEVPVIYVLASVAVGVVVGHHQPGNPLGWLIGLELAGLDAISTRLRPTP